MKITKVVCLVGLVSFFTSCMPPTQYKIVKFNKTPENTAAFRDCQRTFATAVGYDADGFKELKNKCLLTLNMTTYYYQMDFPQSNIDGCEMVESAGTTRYYICPIENKYYITYFLGQSIF
jgi:hypothetical protein